MDEVYGGRKKEASSPFQRIFFQFYIMTPYCKLKDVSIQLILGANIVAKLMSGTAVMILMNLWIVLK